MKATAHYCPFVHQDTRTERWVCLEITTESEEPKRKRARTARSPEPAIGLCLDVSGSMRGSALSNLKKAAKAVVERFEPDQVEIVTFARGAKLLTPGSNKEETKAEIERLRASGPTAMLEGLRMTLERLRDHHNGVGVLRRVFLLTDGHPNIPDQSSKDREGAPNTICALAQISRRKLRCPITSFGLGDNYASALLQSVASESGGEFYDVATPQAISNTIERAASFVHSVKFTDCYLQIQGVGKGEAVSVFGKSAANPWPIGDLYRDDRCTVLIQAVCPGTEGPFLSWRLTGCKAGESVRQTLAEGKLSAQVSSTEPLEDPEPVEISRLLFQISSRTRAVMQQLSQRQRDTAVKLQRSLVSDLDKFKDQDSKIRVAAAHQRQVLRALENGELERANLYQRHSQQFYGRTQRDSTLLVVMASSQSM